MIISSIFFILGACLASFFSCQLYRDQHLLLATNKRSFCETCLKTLTFWQLIPILGFLIQKGRCHFCNAKISLISTLNELFFGSILALIALFLPPDTWLQAIFICSWLFYLSLFDLATHLVPITPLLLGGSLNVILFYPTYSIFEWIVFSFSLLLLLIENFLGKLGIGDTFVIAFLALSLEPRELFFLLLCASLATLIYALFFKLSGELAFIPALFLGYLLTLFV